MNNKFIFIFSISLIFDDAIFLPIISVFPFFYFLHHLDNYFLLIYDREQIKILSFQKNIECFFIDL